MSKAIKRKQLYEEKLLKCVEEYKPFFKGIIGGKENEEG